MNIHETGSDFLQLATMLMDSLDFANIDLASLEPPMHSTKTVFSKLNQLMSQKNFLSYMSA